MSAAEQDRLPSSVRDGTRSRPGYGGLRLANENGMSWDICFIGDADLFGEFRQ
jgi:hypothetical protein